MAASPWFVTPPGGSQAAGPVNLMCLPPAGCSSTVYLAWQKSLAGAARVLPIELPGRGSRMRDAPATQLCPLATQIADAVVPVASAAPYVLFGHSMGAWVTYELAQELQRRGAPAPAHIFVCGNRAPHLCGQRHDGDARVMHQLPFDAFWAAFAQRYALLHPMLEEEDVRRFVWPMFQADFQMVETYAPSSVTTPLAAPLTAVAGDEDTRVTREQVAAWRQHTSGSFGEVWLPKTGHNVVDNPPAQLLEAVKAACVLAAADRSPCNP